MTRKDGTNQQSKIIALHYCSRPIVSKQNGIGPLFFFLAGIRKNMQNVSDRHNVNGSD